VHVSSDELVQCRLQARELRLDSRRPARSAITGGHASRFRGRGMDYLESRAYQPGDDIRSMDWRVTARTNHAHVKLYQEERERPVVVMIDLGPGMFFATQGVFKSVVAARAAALIGWAAIQNGDRIGAFLFNGGHHELRPLGGQRGVMRLIRQLVTATDPAAVPENQGIVAQSSHLNEALLRRGNTTTSSPARLSMHSNWLRHRPGVMPLPTVCKMVYSIPGLPLAGAPMRIIFRHITPRYAN
jgi:uncharacterized protein (DUF58 family)